jgi:hypothetical protein
VCGSLLNALLNKTDTQNLTLVSKWRTLWQHYSCLVTRLVAGAIRHTVLGIQGKEHASETRLEELKPVLTNNN